MTLIKLANANFIDYNIFFPICQDIFSHIKRKRDTVCAVSLDFLFSVFEDFRRGYLVDLPHKQSVHNKVNKHYPCKKKQVSVPLKPHIHAAGGIGNCPRVYRVHYELGKRYADDRADSRYDRVAVEVRRRFLTARKSR